jgi:hypothetical protein
VLLAGDLVKTARAHADGERRGATAQAKLPVNHATNATATARHPWPREVG